MLKTAYLLAKIGADTAENERKFAENYLSPAPDDLYPGEGPGEPRGGWTPEASSLIREGLFGN